MSRHNTVKFKGKQKIHTELYNKNTSTGHFVGTAKTKRNEIYLYIANRKHSFNWKMKAYAIHINKFHLKIHFDSSAASNQLANRNKQKKQSNNNIEIGKATQSIYFNILLDVFISNHGIEMNTKNLKQKYGPFSNPIENPKKKKKLRKREKIILRIVLRSN